MRDGNSIIHRTSVLKFTGEHRDTLLKAYKKAKNPLFLLDYDGTLIESSGELIMQPPTAELHQILKQMCSQVHNDVFIISGRGNKIMDIWLGELRINLVAEHGAYIKYINRQWRPDDHAENKWKTSALSIIHQTMKMYPGSELEEKDFTIAYHFDELAENKKKPCSEYIGKQLKAAFKNSGIEILEGENTVELRCRGIDKKAAVEEILQRRSYDFILAAGNDNTDEDMFSALSGKKSFSIRVGEKKTEAKYIIPAVKDMLSLLSDIAQIDKQSS